MNTILTITHTPGFGSAITAALPASHWRILVEEDAAAAAPLFARQAVDAVILDVDLTDAQILHTVQAVKQHAPTVPLIVFTTKGQSPWEEEAYLLGVAHVLEKPVRARLLHHLLDKIISPPAEHPPQPIHTQPPIAPAIREHPPLRRFSSHLVHSLDATALLQHALQQIRETLGVNRAAILLRKPDALHTLDDPSLRADHSIGHDPRILQRFPLSLHSGLGAHLHKHSRILRATSHEAQASRDILREFQILSSAIAIPIMDRDTLVGILLLDERITGGTFGDEELIPLFHWLEELGTALRNCRHHHQLAAGHTLIDQIIASLGSGCVIIGTNRGIIHANPAALTTLFPEGTRQRTSHTFEFGDLPQQLGSQIFQVIQTGQPAASFKWTPPHRPGTTIGVRIIPFRATPDQRTDAALLVLDDITEQERAIEREIETNKLRLVRQMAWHLSHEIGNALTPISTMQQMMEFDIDPDSRKELAGALGNSVRRIQRLTQQMNFLSRDWDGKGGETVKLADLLESAYHEAHTLHPGKRVARLDLDRTNPTTITGDTKALRHAFSELMLNALQANPDNPTITIRIQKDPNLSIEVQDAGPGFPSDIADQIGVPFQSTRSVGLGLGLTVTRKIIENHLGKLEIPPTGAKGPGIVRVTIPPQAA